MIMSKTTLTVEKTTRDKLATYGSKGSTFDQIIQKLLENK